MNNALMQLAAITTAPFVIGTVVGYGLRSYVSMVRRSRQNSR
jgi:hypothetical protein